MPDNEESGFSQSVLPRRSGQVYWNTAALTLTALRAIDSESRRNLQIVFVLETPGMYYYDANSTDTEASPRIIAPTDNSGRWKLISGIAVAANSNVIIYKQATTPPINAGDIWYDTGNNQWRGCNGTDWDTILG